MTRLCDNCRSELVGSYCAQCGQSTATLDVPVGAFVSELASETFALDGRLRTTLRPLFLSPGTVARAYASGQRARFVPPIRMYLFASFAMFVVLARSGGANITETRTGPSTGEATEVAVETDGPVQGTADVELDLGGGALEATLQQRLQEGFTRVAADRERFNQEFLGMSAQAMFFLLPAFALFLKVVYRRRLFVHHVVFAIYLHSFGFLLVTAAELPNAIGFPTVGAWTDVLVLWVPPYLVLALRRFYDSSWIGAFVKATVVSIAYSILGGITLIAVLTMALLNT